MSALLDLNWDVFVTPGIPMVTSDLPPGTKEYPGHAQCWANRGSETCLLQSNRRRTARVSQPAPGGRVH